MRYAHRPPSPRLRTPAALRGQSWRADKYDIMAVMNRQIDNLIEQEMITEDMRPEPAVILRHAFNRTQPRRLQHRSKYTPHYGRNEVAQAT